MEGTRSGAGRHESEEERLDRNLQELLQELRVALPGVQVLFAFLLVVPFNQRFPQITNFQQTIYFVTLLLATGATGFLIAPTVHHRVQFRQQEKERIVITANRFTIVGMALLAAAMTGAILLITDMLYRETTVTVVAGSVAVMFAVLWYAVPLRRSMESS
jgi:uncharacterized protein involved in cysteine biosynthesis